jgi:hypothetical protein
MAVAHLERLSCRSSHCGEQDATSGVGVEVGGEEVVVMRDVRAQV